MCIYIGFAIIYNDITQYVVHISYLIYSLRCHSQVVQTILNLFTRVKYSPLTHVMIHFMFAVNHKFETTTYNIYLHMSDASPIYKQSSSHFVQVVPVRYNFHIILVT